MTSRVSEPPHDNVAEQATLGSMIMNRKSILEASHIVKSDHFYIPKHGEIFAAIMALYHAGEPADAVTIVNKLSELGILQRIGGAPYVHDLIKSTPIEHYVESYARIVFDKWRQRQLVSVGQRLCQLGMTSASDSSEVDELIMRADEFFRDVDPVDNDVVDWDDLVVRWQKWQTQVGNVIPTPWPEANKWFPGGGLAPGQLVIIGGRPGQGKSNAGLNAVLKAAESGVKSIVFSVEMDDVEVASRLLAAGSWAQVGQLFSKNLDERNRGLVDDYIERSSGMGLSVVDKPNLTVEEIISTCRRHRPEMIFVDYAQLLQASNSRLPRHEQVGHITRSLKIAAKSMHMVVVVAAQLKRPENRRQDGSVSLPKIEDLRESGAAEQDADIVMLLHRPENAESVWIVIGKNRNGSTGKFRVRFRGENARVGDV